ncbi:SNF2-related protein [Microbacterium sp. CIAB417]|uniref:DEAD/DEAH box helicase n=1 Tax=Microbacterium sp. CIAB417 TaxID=2860287 RepID=UPI001FACEA21|nr:SNF2-related protein [Microbacterium sp. CIAB417]
MTAPFVPEHDILAHTDRGSFDRGHAYARTGRVLYAIWDDARRRINGQVSGSRGMPYSCAIEFADDDRIASSRCACPVRTACKHVVAVLLASNDKVALPTDTAPPVRARPPVWRTLLAGVPQTPPAGPLALGIELRRRPAQGVHQWAPRPVVAAHPRDLVKDPGEALLAVRPLMRSASTGNWIQGDAGWDTLRRSVGRFAPDQVRWFTDLLSLARESLLSGTAGDWILLDHVASRLLWAHLAEASELGIDLVATQKHTDVRMSSHAEVGAEIHGDEEALLLDSRVYIDGVPQDSRQVRPIGRSGVYAWEVVGARIRLTLAPVELTPMMHTLLTRPGSIEVPAEERDDFLAEAYPHLVRQVPLQASDEIALPSPPEPRAVISVDYQAGHVLTHSLQWDYEGFGRFAPEPSPDAVRDAAGEARLLEALREAWEPLTEMPFAVRAERRDADAAEFVSRIVPALEAAGAVIETRGKPQAYRELTGDPLITVSTVETTSTDWFDLGILVSIDGRTIPFEPLFTALALRRSKLLLVDGSYFSLAHPALQRLRDLLDEAAELAEWESGPRISRHQIALWEEFEDLADEAQPAVSWRATAEGLRSADSVPATETPAGLRALLRPYQQAGFDWLAFLWRHRLGGILADDMGLGKTLQLLTLILHMREQGEERPVLVVAPTSVLGTWQDEATRFAPDLTVRLLDGTSAKRGQSVAEAAASADVVVTSYTVTRLDQDEYAAVEWAALILDEAQFVKNPATQQHRAVAALRADVTFVVTGTPLENSLSELWALLRLAAPGLFPSARRFRQEYIQPIEQGKVPENEEGAPYRRRRLERLRRRIRPLLLRRTKELVADDLPPKQEQVLHVDLSPQHRALYDTVLQRERQKVLGLLQDLDRNRFIVFRSLTMLRMLSLAPALIDPEDAAIGSAKLDVLLERVQELQAEGHRALVFSQFTSFLGLAAERLAEAGVPAVYLDGSTRDRRAVIEDFRSGDQPVFLISLKAGGFGLTLTEADYVFLLDPWWNPAAEAQAVDRAHRIGQREQVFVYRMIATGTVEEKVLALQQRKARLFTAVMDDEQLFAQSLSAEDIRGLFED